jgi:hypothetical protein
MSIPELWGIDPDMLYSWTPNEGREIVSEAVREGGKLVKASVYGEVKPGAPVVLVAPLTGQLLTRVEAAQKRFASALAHGKDGARSEAEILDDINAVYSDDLVDEVLCASIKGFRNLKTRGGSPITLSKDWAKDKAKIPAGWRAELFYAIVDGSAYSGEEIASFG